MKSLLYTKINWTVYLAVAVFIFLLFPNLSLFSYFAILVSLHQFFLLFFSISYVLPIRYLFGTLMCLQMLIGPVLAYNGVDKYQYFMYTMKIPEFEYFSYVLPAVVLFIMGLHISAGDLKGEKINVTFLKEYISNRRTYPFWLIGIGFVSSIVAVFFSSDLGFVFYLLGNFKYIGVFLLVLSDKQLKVFALLLVYGSIILSSLSEGMFHDLLTWLIMIGAVLAIKYKPSTKVKLIFSSFFILMTITIQQVKQNYRSATTSGQETGIATFQKVVEAKQENNSLFDLKSIGASTVRINQGFIITNIMKTVPSKVPFSNGAELWMVIEAAILPRVLAPDKLKAGDRSLFTRYTGLNLRTGTSMGLSSVGDAYINFGIVGGCIFMFVLGLLYNLVLKQFHKYSKHFPILLLFVPLVFYYPIRPDCELQTILGHLVKSCFLIFVIFLIWKKEFRMNYRPFWKKYSS